MSRHDRDEEVLTRSKTETRNEIKEPPRYKVLLHNDDYTTMEFVIFVLVTVFQRTTSDALRLTQQVHVEGLALAGVYPYEIAEMKVEKVTQLAREREFPFLCTMEEE